MKLTITNRMTFSVPVADTVVHAGCTIDLSVDTIPDNILSASKIGYIYYTAHNESSKHKVDRDTTKINNSNKGDNINA